MAMIAVVFQSERGHTKTLADAILKGIVQVPDVSGQIFEVAGKDIFDGSYRNDALMEMLDACDGIVFGCATYMGSGSAIFKSFLEAAFRLRWLEQRWKDKVSAGFTNSASQNGDKFCSLM